MSKPKLFELFDAAVNGKAYGRLNNPIVVTLENGVLCAPTGVVLVGNTTFIFKSPCASSAAVTFRVDGVDFEMVDANGKSTAAGNFFVTGAIVTVTVDVEAQKAYVQNGASSSVAIADSAPTDTTALWADTGEGVLKYYADSEWKPFGAVFG